MNSGKFRRVAASAVTVVLVAAAVGCSDGGDDASAPAQDLPPESALPGCLWDAAQALKASEAARQLFGDAFVEHFAASREWEEREFRKAITDWELKRYFEII